jgi:hypothetical protein
MRVIFLLLAIMPVASLTSCEIFLGSRPIKVFTVKTHSNTYSVYSYSGHATVQSYIRVVNDQTKKIEFYQEAIDQVDTSYLLGSYIYVVARWDVINEPMNYDTFKVYITPAAEPGAP